MKKIYNILLSFVFAGCLLGSCDYLDIVPNETANEEDAFASEQAALNYLYSCLLLSAKTQKGINIPPEAL